MSYSRAGKASLTALGRRKPPAQLVAVVDNRLAATLEAKSLR